MTYLETIAHQLSTAAVLLERAADMIDSAGQTALNMRELTYGAQWRANAHRFRADAVLVQHDSLRVRDIERDQLAAASETDQP